MTTYTHGTPECPDQVTQALEYFHHQLGVLPGRWWVAGGAVRDYFAEGRAGKDIDVFTPDDDEMKKVVAALLDPKGPFKGKVLYDSPTVTGYRTEVGRVEVVKNHFPTALATIAVFDFTVCCAVYDPAGAAEPGKPGTLTVHETFWIDLACRRLVVNALPFPLSSLERIGKFIRRGYRACNGTLLRFVQEIQKVDLTDPKQNHLEFYRSGQVRFRRID
jgi:hypothetical protein